MIGNVGLIGIILVIIGVIIAIRKDIQFNFIYLMVTSILTTTAVFTIGENSITIPHVISLIFTLKVLYEIYVGNIELYLIRSSIFYYLGFCILSIPVGIIFSKIMRFDVNYSVGTMLIQVIYLIMCICIFYFVRVAHLNDRLSFKDFHLGLVITTIELFFLSCLQLIDSNMFNYLFVNRSGHAFIQTLENGQQRITAAFNEPSMLAIYLALALIYFTFMSILNCKNLIFVIICLFVGLISRGSSFILASILWLIISGVIIVKRTTVKQLIVIISSLICVSFLINLLTGNLIVNEVMSLINKIIGNGTSGSERLLHLKNSMSHFLSTPVFGLGYGVIRSTDWLTTLLANTGIIGILLLGKFFLTVISNIEHGSIQLKGIKISIFVTLLLLLISVPEPYFSFMWIFIAFSLPAAPICERKVSINKEDNIKTLIKRYYKQK